VRYLKWRDHLWFLLLKSIVLQGNTSLKWLHFISMLWLLLLQPFRYQQQQQQMMVADVPTPVETIYLDMINLPLCYRILFMTYWPNIKVLKLMRMRWVGHIAWLGKKRNTYRSLVAKPKHRVCFEDLCVNGRIMLKRDLETSGGLLCTDNEPLVNGECFDMLRTLSCVVLHINCCYNYCHGLPCWISVAFFH